MSDDRALDTSEVPAYRDGLRLDGKRIVVAGAGQGIGRQTCHALAQAGARLVCMDVDSDAADHVARETDGIPVVADVRDPGDLARVLDAAESEFGGLDGIVDIVGMAKWGPLTHISDEDADWTFDMVYKHAWHLVRLGGTRMRKTGGAMCFIASVSGMTGAQWHAPYGAAKAALISLVKSSAVEFGPNGIRVNAVAPGVVWTPRVSAMVDDEGKQQNIDNTPLRRVAIPADIAAAALFLMSPQADYITGQTLVVDGGVGVKFPYPLDALQ